MNVSSEKAPPASDDAAAVRRRILVVDDDKEVVSLLCDYLEVLYDVESAPDAMHAIACIHRKRPDLVFLDINMPGINGVEGLKLIKEIDTTIPVIMLTANTDNALAADAIKSGAFSYVPKPFKFKYVHHLLAAAWSRPGARAI